MAGRKRLANPASESSDIEAIKPKRKKESIAETAVHQKNSACVKKKVSEGKLRVVDFIFQLRDSNLVFTALENFITSADEFPIETDYDIIKEFCQSSKDGSEILSVLETGKRKTSEYQLIFSSLERILLRIADDLSQFVSMGKAIVQQILNKHTGALYYQLAMRNKSAQIKSALKLLTSMVMLNVESAMEVLSQVQFSNSFGDLYSLFYRRDVKDPQDVRTCVILFVMAFLVTRDERLTRQLVEQKLLLQTVFKDIHMDKITTIQTVLTTMLEEIVKNVALNKTVKVRLFNEQTLQQLCKLFGWRGPVKWNASNTLNKTKDITLDPVMEEERNTITQLLTRFLQELCCSQKTGIIFYDNTYGCSSRNMNQLLTTVLTTLKDYLSDADVRQLVINILQASPDQIEGFVKQFRGSASPRESAVWLERVQFIIQIYKQTRVTAPLLKLTSCEDVTMLLRIIRILILPPVLEELLKGLKHTSLAVRDSVLDTLLVILSQTVQVMEVWLNSKTIASLYSPSERLDFQHGLTDLMAKNLPNLPAIMQAWQMAVKTDTGNEKGIRKSRDETVDIVKGSISRHQLDNMIKTQEVLCLYVEVFPRSMTSDQINIGGILEGVREVLLHETLTTDTEVTEKICRLQLNLLKILSKMDNKNVPWTKVTGGGNSVTFLLMEMMVNTARHQEVCRQMPQLLCKMIVGTGFFEMTSSEILLWLNHLQNCQTANQTHILKFFASVLTSFLSNPYPYIDKTVQSFTLEGAAAYEDLDKETVGGTDVKLDLDILMEEDNELSGSLIAREQNTYRHEPERLDFSPLVVVAMEALEKDDKDCVQFVSGVLLDILHCQKNPEALCLLIHNSKPLQKHSQHMPYFLAFNKLLYKGERKKKLVLNLPENLCALLMKLYCCFPALSNDTAFLQKVNDKIVCGQINIQSVVQQLCLYIRTDISRHYKDPKTSKAGIKLYFSLVRKLLNQALDQQTSVSVSNSADTSSDGVEGNSLPGENSGMAENLCDIFLGDLILSWLFLSFCIWPEITDINSGKRPNSALPELVTLEISKVVKSLRLNQIPNVEGKMKPYVEKVSLVLTDCVSCASRRLDLFLMKSVRKAVDAFLCYFPAKSLAESAGSLLSLWQTTISSINKTADVSQLEELLTRIICKLSSCDTFDLQLHLEEVTIIFKLMSSVNTVEFYRTCLQLVRKWPHYALAAERHILPKLLNHGEDVGVELSAQLLSESSDLHQHFFDWFNSISLEKWSRYIRPILAVVKGWCREGNKERVQPIRHKLWPFLCKWLMFLQSSVDSRVDLDIAQLWLVLLQYTDQGDLKGIFYSLLTKVKEKSGFCPLHIRTLRVVVDGLTNETVPDKHEQHLLACLRLLVDTGHRDTQNIMEDLLVTIRQTLEVAEISEKQTEDIAKLWPMAMKTLLKSYYTNSDSLDILRDLLTVLYQTPADNSPHLSELYQMIMSHSKCFPVLFGNESLAVKESLVSLLLAVVERCPDSCDSSHVPILLGAYNASLSSTDQNLLKLLMLYEKSGVDLNSYRPWLWGTKATQYYTMKTKGKSVSCQVTANQVIELLDRDKLVNSICNFPLRQTQQEDIVKSSDLKSTDDCYDARFLLTVFIQILGPENVVDCYQFIETRCLGYIFASLSCHDDSLRKMGYLALSLFHQQVEGSKFAGKDQVLCLMTTFRNSLSASNTKLACVISHFIDQALVTFCKPESHMFLMVNAFLLLKPDLDFLNVPEFYKLFNSSACEFKQERAWMLKLLCSGLRETSDYRIYQRRFVFKLILSFFQSSLSDNWCKIQILKIVLKACQERSVLSDLVRKHALLTWLSSVVDVCSLLPEASTLLVSIVDKVWVNMVTDRTLQLDVSDPLQYEVFTLLKHIISNFNVGTPLQTATQCLKTFVSVLAAQQKNAVKSGIGYSEVGILMLYFSSRVKNTQLRGQIHTILESLQFRGLSMVSKKALEEADEADETSDDPLKSEVKKADKESVSSFLQAFCDMLVYWEPSEVSENMESKEIAVVIATLCKTVMIVFLTEPFSSDRVEKILMWFKAWLQCGSAVSQCLCEQVLNTGGDGCPSLMVMLLNLYSECPEDTDKPVIPSDWTGVCSGVPDKREVIRLLNSVFMSLAEHCNSLTLPGEVMSQLLTKDTHKGVKKKCLASGRKKGHDIILKWTKSITNHLWYSCSACGGDAVELKRLWHSILHHVIGVHEWEDEDGTKHSCKHEPLSKEEQELRMWFDPLSTVFRDLKSIVMDDRLNRDLEQLTLFKHTGGLESYHSTMLKFAPKRLHFHYASMNGRMQLAVIDHNYNTGRETATTRSGKPVYRYVQSKQKGGEWTAKKVTQAKSHHYATEMLTQVVERRRDQSVVYMDKESHVGIPQLPKNIAKERRPPVEELLAKKLKK